MKFDPEVEEMERIDMTPMVDAIFAIILFLLVCSSMVEQMEQDVSIELPTSGKIAVGKPPPAPPVVVNVRALPPQGRPVYSVGGETMSLLDLQQRLTWTRMQRKEQASVVIRGDRNVKWEHIAVILAYCARAGITKVSATFEILEGG